MPKWDWNMIYKLVGQKKPMNDQERKANVQWAQAAFDKYDDLMRDFKEYKEKTNALFGNL